MPSSRHFSCHLRHIFTLLSGELLATDIAIVLALTTRHLRASLFVHLITNKKQPQR